MRNYDPKTGIFKFESQKQWFDEGLANGILNLFFPRNVIDLGCGLGAYVKFFTEAGWIIDGYEGGNTEDFAYHFPIYHVDLSEPVNFSQTYDLTLCLEVGEHIPKNREHFFLDNLCAVANDWLVISWADEGGPKAGHVNIKTNKETITTLNNCGFYLHEKCTDYLRKKATIKWFKKVFVFKKKI